MAVMLEVRLLSRPEFIPPEWWVIGDGSDGEELAEFAGRQCYESWLRPNPETATNSGYIGNIITHRHFSVLEHANYTLRFTGVSRSFSHELVRHRHFSYSQLSQRYVDGSIAEYVIPPVIRDLPTLDRVALESTLNRVMVQARADYAYIYTLLRSRHGLSKKAARGAARAVLPEMTETKVVVTGNLRAYREFFDKRISSAADQEIVEAAQATFDILYAEAQNAFQDAPEWFKSGNKPE